MLVRHGETEWTERGLLHGRLDSPLSARGRHHAKQTAQRLQGERFNAFYCSPLGRALQTANIISPAVGLKPQPFQGFEEADFGCLEGRRLARWEPDGTGTMILRPITRLVMRLTAEKPAAFGRRVQSAQQRLAGLHPQGRVLVVTHWAVIGALTALLLEGDTAAWRRYGPWAACGISEFQRQDGAWTAVCLNDHEHLKEATT
jgi:probable phosphoglycerate mutase